MESFFENPKQNLKIPLSLVPKCGPCGYHRGCKNPKQKVQGRGKRRILIIGDHPDEETDKTGGFFTRDEKLIVSRILDRNGINIDRDCWITGSLICKPSGQHDKRTATDFCRPNIMKLLQDLEPTVVILMGEYGIELIRYLWKDEGLSFDDWVGWKIPAQKINAWVCPTYHPSMVLEQGKGPKGGLIEMAMGKHLKEAVKACDAKPYAKVPNYEKRVKILQHYDSIVEAIKRYRVKKEPTAFDYETTMLKPDHPQAEIICVSLSDGDETVVFPFRRDVRRPLFHFLFDADVPKIASNTKFEDRWSKRILGVDVKGWWHDTMLAAHVLDNRGGISSIKFQAFVLLGQPDYDSSIKEYLKSRDPGGYGLNRVKQAPVKPLLLYCGLDSLLEYLVAKKQKKLLKKEEG